MNAPNYVFIETGHRPRTYKEIMRGADRVGLRFHLETNPRTAEREAATRKIYRYGEEQ